MIFRSHTSYAFVLLAGFFAQASFASIPSDLDDLMKRYEAVEKTDQIKDLIQVGQETISIPQEEMNLHIIEKEMSQLKNNIGVKRLNFARLQKDGRKEFLRDLFPAGDRSLAFCQSFPKVEVKPKEGEILTPDQLAEKQLKANLAKCKKEVSSILGGITHADPMVYLFEVQYEGDELTETTIYIRSVIDSKEFLRYQFKL